jgi:YihY family inner membrane protein
MIALVGLARALGAGSVSDLIVRTVKGSAPGPVADLLTTAISQAQANSDHRHYVGLLLGAAGWLLTATTAMGQLERGLNRLYGVEQDRPSVRKYGLALLLAASVGALLTVSVAVLAFGRSLSHSIDNGTLARAWDVISWPVGVLVTVVAMALLFHWSPRRRQPSWSWLAYGSTVSMLIWGVITVALGVFLRHSASFGQTYGPLAGMVALLLWSFFSGVAVFYGAAVAAQLEAVRAHAAEPQDEEKVANSEPDGDGDAAEAGRIPIMSR